MKNRFQRGSGCFACRSCGKQTRASHDDNETVGLCPRCNAVALRGNELADETLLHDPWAELEKCATEADVHDRADELLKVHRVPPDVWEREKT